jgi:hypothetical protein
MKNKNQSKIIILVVSILIIILSIFLLIKNYSTPKLWNKDSWQAVFLDNNQVYFGKISYLSNDTVYMKEVYYLQTNESEKTGESTLNLIKLGSEFHGPTDEMVINRSNVLFWENLKADSKVVKTIQSLNNQY